MLDPVSKILSERYAKFHHAAQLRDFTAYCQHNALLSRDRLASSCTDYTRFYTDEADKKHGVWGRTFGNLQDYGSLFWFVDNTIPNCYGPITISFDRTIWSTCMDVALTTSNPGDKTYDLHTDRLSDTEVSECFQKDGQFWKLKNFGLDLSVSNSELPLDLATLVTVEPINDEIFENVKTQWQAAGLDLKIVKMRNLKNSIPSRMDIFHLLVDWAINAAGNLPDFSNLQSVVPKNLTEWFKGVRETLYPALRQWLIYTYIGTLR